jgi:alpha,alpha-trehalase
MPFVTLRAPGWSAGSPVAAVIFDLDGVITDTATVHAAAWKALFDRFLSARPPRPGEDHSPFTDDDYRRLVDGKARHDGVASFLAARGIELETGDPDDESDLTVHGLGNSKNRQFLETLAARGVPLFTTSAALVSRLREHGVRTAVVSASENCAAVLEAGGVSALFDARVDGVEARRLSLPGKPDPALFVEAAARLGTDPHDAAVVEDAIVGVQAGRTGRFGVVVGVDRSGHSRELTQAGADVVVDDLGRIGIDAARDGRAADLGNRGNGGNDE